MKALPVLNPKSAGIDLGSENLYGLIAGDAPKVFGTFTGDLESLRDWFQAQGLQTVAIEATGGYLAVCLRSAGSDRAGGGGGQRLPWCRTCPGARRTWRAGRARSTSPRGWDWPAGSKQSGKRKDRVKGHRNRAGRMFCAAALALGQSVDKALGGFYRRLRSRVGGLAANVALAR